MSYADNLTRFNLQSLQARREDHCRRLFSTVLSDQTHTLRALLTPENNSHYNLRTKRRFQRFVSKTNRFNNTFLPCVTTFSLFNHLIHFDSSIQLKYYTSILLHIVNSFLFYIYIYIYIYIMLQWNALQSWDCHLLMVK